MQVWSNLKIAANRDSKPRNIAINDDAAINVESEVLLIYSNRDIFLSANPVFISENLGTDCRFLKLVNTGNYQITLNAAAISDSENLVINSQQIANFLYIPNIGWLYQKNPNLTSQNNNLAIVAKDIIPAYSLINIFTDVDGLRYCRLADRRYGDTMQVDGFIQEGCSIGDIPRIYTSGLFRIPNANFVLNQIYYLGNAGQISDSTLINPQDVNNRGTLIQSIGRAVDSHIINFEPQLIAVNRSGFTP